MQQHISHKKYIVYFKKALTKTSITSHRKCKIWKIQILNESARSDEILRNQVHYIWAAILNCQRNWPNKMVIVKVFLYQKLPILSHALFDNVAGV